MVAMALAGVALAGFGAAQGGAGGGGFAPGHGAGSPAAVATDALVIPLATGSTTIYYVSSSDGNDSDDGTTEALAKQTLTAGIALLTSGTDCRLLLKRGDVWTNENLGVMNKGGASAAGPLVIGAYGTGDRPLIKIGTGTGISTINGGQNAHVAFQDLEFYAHTRDPGSADYVDETGGFGLSWLSGANNVVFERVTFRYCANNRVQDFGNFGIQSMTFKDCDFLDSYNTAAHAQGLYFEPTLEATGLFGPVVFDGCVFDHNGWNDDSTPVAPKTLFNHGLYTQNSDYAASTIISNVANLTVKRCVFLRNASHGVQMRSGGTVKDNLFVRCAISVLIGSGDNPTAGGVLALVKDNVILQGTDIVANPRGLAIELDNIDTGTTTTVSGNRIANVADVGINNAAVFGAAATDATLSDNIASVWIYSTPVASEQLTATTSGLADPTRSLATYDTTRGGPGTAANAYTMIRSRSYLLADLLVYFRAGLNP